MATNLAIDPELLEPAVAISGERTKKAVVTKALQELLQGFSGAKSRAQIIDRFAALPLLQPDRDDHVAAAELRNACRRAGVRIGTIDAVLAQLCIRHDLTMLSTDGDFEHAAAHCALRLWTPKPRNPMKRRR